MTTPQQLHHEEAGRCALVTCSYGPDLARCVRLCNSVDNYVPTAVQHCLIVPRRDQHLFAHLANARRRVVCVEDVVPGNFRQLPRTNRWWLSPGLRPVRGWIMQQVTKLSASYAVDREYIIFADSDLQFVRPLDLSRLIHKGRLRLHRVPGEGGSGRHLQWQHRAADLLGLARRDYGADYVGQLITWRRSHLQDLHRQLEQRQRRPWAESIARSLHISEYMLYGLFVSELAADGPETHFANDDALCHCCWFPEELEELSRAQWRIEDAAQAVLLQSNLQLNMRQVDRVMHQVRQHLNTTVTGRA